MEQSYSVLAD
jgi:hypothetical protein